MQAVLEEMLDRVLGPYHLAPTIIINGQDFGLAASTAVAIRKGCTPQQQAQSQGSPSDGLTLSA